MFALCLLLAVEATLSHVATGNDASNAKNRPVTKVINLLKDMGAQLEKEAEEDEETYEKVACWCETNDKEKTAAIAEAEARITDLTSTIEELTATSARLNTEIKNLEAEIAKNQEALDKATAMRQKELAEFNEEEKDMLQSIGALKSAIVVLSKHHSSLAQVPSETLLNMAAVIDHQFKKHTALLHAIVTPSQRKAIAAFVQSPGDYFDAEPTFKQSYAPQSGQIFGILKQMKETFETNLSASQKEEMQAQAAYEDLKAAKESEIKAGTELKDTKTQELADTDEKLAQSKQDLEDTRNSLSADQKFLMNLKETCQMTDQEWEERQKSRAEEIKAVSEALAILSSDDAHDTFTKTFNFVQTKVETTDRQNRDKASALLFKAAKANGNPRLAALAARVRLDAFTKVKAAIDEMIAALLKEKADEIKHKDFCTEGLNTNERESELKARDIAELEAEISDLTMTIDELTKSIATLEAEIAEMQTQLKRAGEDREMENKDFQQTVADQRETKALLKKAYDVLAAVFKKFIQLEAKESKQEPAGPPPPPGFKEYKQSSGSGGVMGMLEQIMRDTETLEAEAIKAESDAQKAYETYVKDTNKSIEEKTRDITNKTEEKATADGDKVAAEEAKETAMNEQQQLMNENADLHKSCDFTLKNFDIRQTARDQEVEALRQAKAILSGAKFLFLQKRA
jgi:uncharacterized small protein (DUF1192 family)